jgi:hypothetical protein
MLVSNDLGRLSNKAIIARAPGILPTGAASKLANLQQAIQNCFC